MRCVPVGVLASLLLAPVIGCVSWRSGDDAPPESPKQEGEAELAMRSCERTARIRNPAMTGLLTYRLTIDREDQIVEMEIVDRPALVDDQLLHCLVDAVKGKRVRHRPLKPGITALESRLALRLREGDEGQSLSIEAAPWLHKTH